ncbi:MAG TPA: PPC domain-containing protein [Urbifossiella sp.]
MRNPSCVAATQRGALTCLAPRWVAATLVLFASTARAELPSPRFDRLAPLGAAAGSTVEVEVAGADVEDAKTLLFDHPGIKATNIKDRKFKVAVAADVPEGTYDARLVAKWGISNPRLFAVSRGSTDLAEKEPNDEPAAAQVVAVNSIVNGTSDQGREDVFRFSAKKGQRIVAECFAQRLDSQLDGVLAITDVDGRQLASNGDYAGKDPFVEFVAPKDGDYFATLNDLSFRGGQPYRLLITDRPHVENLFPRAVQAGKSAALTAFGRNLGPHAKTSPLIVNDLPLDALAETIAVPNAGVDRGFRFTEHPTGHSVLPTAATCTLTGFQHRGIPLLLSDTPVTLEAEPNDTPAKPQLLSLPAVVSARFDKERDADWYEIEPPENGGYSIEVYCERIAGRADPYVVVLDDKENRVAELDDFGIRTNAFDGHIRDVSGSVNLNAKKKYRVLVQDRYRRGGPRYQYVLSIRQAIPDFFPVAIHHQNPGPGGTTIFQGGAVYLDIIIHTAGGFSGPIAITASGLPKGVHAIPTTINNDNRGVFVLWADKDAADWIGPVKLMAEGKSGEQKIVREVRPYSRVWQSTDLNSSRPTRELEVAVREMAPFSVGPVKDRVEVEAGKKLEVKVKCERLWPDFKAKIDLQGLSFPGPIKMNTVSIAEGKDEATVTIEVQSGTRPGEYTVALQCQGQVPFVKDAKAGAKANTLVSLPSRPMTIVVLPAAKR